MSGIICETFLFLWKTNNDIYVLYQQNESGKTVKIFLFPSYNDMMKLL